MTMLESVARLMSMVGKEVQAPDLVMDMEVMRIGRLARIEITETEVVGVIYQAARIYRMPADVIELEGPAL